MVTLLEGRYKYLPLNEFMASIFSTNKASIKVQTSKIVRIHYRIHFLVVIFLRPFGSEMLVENFVRAFKFYCINQSDEWQALVIWKISGKFPGWIKMSCSYTSLVKMTPFFVRFAYFFCGTKDGCGSQIRITAASTNV